MESCFEKHAEVYYDERVRDRRYMVQYIEITYSSFSKNYFQTTTFLCKQDFLELIMGISTFKPHLQHSCKQNPTVSLLDCFQLLWIGFEYNIFVNC